MTVPIPSTNAPKTSDGRARRSSTEVRSASRSRGSRITLVFGFLLLLLLIVAGSWGNDLRASAIDDRTGELRPWTLRHGDRIVMLGSEYLEQDRKENLFEAALTRHFDDLDLTIRTLGWAGDTPSASARGYFNGAEEGFARLTAELERLQPTVVMLFYGANLVEGDGDGEAEADRFAAFLRGYERLVDLIRRGTDRIVVVSPLPAEQLAPPWPDPSAINRERRAVTEALRRFVDRQGPSVRFVDLFTTMTSRLDESDKPMTHDTIRYNANGYRVIAGALLDRLGVPHDFEAEGFEQLRTLIARKNDLVFHRYRPQNETYLRGFRQHEQGQNAIEIAEFDAWIARAEARIRAFVRGEPLPPELEGPPERERAFEANTPEQQRALFTLDEGLEIAPFAVEPMVANPIHMNFDARGRLWVATSPIYPQIRPGARPKDQILILEDTDGDGRADQRTVFADDLLIPTAVLPDERGGAFVANSTELLHLVDDDGDGRADRRRVVLAGFGTEDTHHILHTFGWGPDAALRFFQSIYIHSHVETPFGVRRLMGSGLWRLRPETGRLDVVMRGLVNPWGLAFDRYGQAFATDGAGGEGINDAFPGSAYTTAVDAARILQGLNPGQPKHCGLVQISGRHFPQRWRDDLLTADFRGNRINRFTISEQGSGYLSRQRTDVLTSRDPAFRPDDLKLGPDGALYNADWHNPIINHGEVDFRDPRRDDRHGRIWRLSVAGRRPAPAPSIVDASIEGLLDLLKSPEETTRRLAKVHLKLRDPRRVDDALGAWVERLDPDDPDSDHHRLEALWTSEAIRRPSIPLLNTCLTSDDHRVRAAAVRVLSTTLLEAPATLETSGFDSLSALERAVHDEHPRVRLEALYGLRTFGTAEAADVALEALDHGVDANLDYALWLTIRELKREWLGPFLAGSLAFADNARKVVFALRAIEDPAGLDPLVALLKAGRVADEQHADVLDLIGRLGRADHLQALWEIALAQPERREACLAALVRAARRRGASPTGDLGALATLLDEPDALRLVGLWRVEPLRPRLSTTARDVETAPSFRRAAIDGLAALGAVDDLRALADVAQETGARSSAIAALVGLDPEGASALAVDWLTDLDPEEADALAPLLDAFLRDRDGPSTLAGAIRGVVLDRRVATRAVRRIGAADDRVRPLLEAFQSAGGLATVAEALTPEERAALVEEVARYGDPSRGEAIYRRTELACVTCHAIGTGGGRVGPNLMSLGASSPVDYIVESLLEPSAKIKEGYNATVVATSDGRILNGLLVREGARELVLLDANNREVVVPSDEIDERVISPTSLMPANLTATLRRDEFLDLTAFLAALGTDGPYCVPTNRYVRTWELADGSTLTSHVDGTLPMAEVRGNTVAFSIEVTRPGSIGLRINNTNGLRITRNDLMDNLRAERIVLDLPRGRHRFAFKIAPGRTAPLRVELIDLEDPAGRAELID